MGMDRPPLDRMLEFGIYTDDVESTAAFYERVFGFGRLVSDRRLVALDVSGRGVLLVFERGGSTRAIDTPNGVLPPHDGRGTPHFAFGVPAGSLDRWEAWLAHQAIEIESTMEWDRGGRSLYFRDPEGHLVELVTPGTWPTW